MEDADPIIIKDETNPFATCGIPLEQLLTF